MINIINNIYEKNINSVYTLIIHNEKKRYNKVPLSCHYRQRDSKEIYHLLQGKLNKQIPIGRKIIEKIYGR